MEAIPVLDLSPLRSEPDNPQQLQKLAQALDSACRTVGFFYISGHGVSQAELTELVGLVERLFALPQATKAGLDACKSQMARGYNSLQHGKHNCTPEDGQQDVKESFTVGVEREAGDPRPPSPMHGPNQWPPEDQLPGWRAEVLAAFDALMAAARLLMRGLALALHQPQSFFLDKCRDPVAQMVMFRYPPTGDRAAERGCGAHTDCGFLTFVAQDAPGIEVQLKDGSWYTAPSLPGTFLVNLGDMCQRWTGDMYRSTVHRVVNRSAATTRHSLVFFCNLDFDAMVEQIQIQCQCEDGGQDSGSGAEDGGGSGTGTGTGSGTGSRAPVQYPPVKAGEYMLQKLGLMYN